MKLNSKSLEIANLQRIERGYPTEKESKINTEDGVASAFPSIAKGLSPKEIELFLNKLKITIADKKEIIPDKDEKVVENESEVNLG